MSDPLKGILALIAACTVWGLSGIYYKLLDHVPPLEVLTHRTLWSLIFFAGLLGLQGRLNEVRAALNTPRKARIIGFAALMISLNWFVFISSIQWGRAVEASFGYYVFPIVAVLFGAAMFRERLSPVQWAAVALVVSAVVLLAVGLGTPPYIAMILAVSFGLYGVVKKGLSIGPRVSVTAEVLMLSPLALTALLWFEAGGQGAFTHSLRDAGLLAFSGLLTGTPLILFSYATQRVPLATVGLLQYLNPTLQAVVATQLFGEPFTLWHKLAFGAIWVAIAIYSGVAVAQDRAARRALVRSGTVGTIRTKSKSDASANP